MVGSHQQQFRSGQSKHLGGVEIDDDLKFRRLLDPKIAWLCALEDLVDVGRRAVPDLYQIITERNQSPDLRVKPMRINRRKPASRDQLHDALRVTEQKPARGDEESASPSVSRGFERSLGVVGTSYLERVLHAEIVSCESRAACRPASR